MFLPPFKKLIYFAIITIDDYTVYLALFLFCKGEQNRPDTRFCILMMVMMVTYLSNSLSF